MLFLRERYERQTLARACQRGIYKPIGQRSTLAVSRTFFLKLSSEFAREKM
jgi:hypothetical protein